jgi:hypothetical protein
MSASPRTYRIYCYDHRSKIVSADWLDSTTDDEAVAEARAKGFGSQCEIWVGTRMVARLADERREA